MTLKELFSIFGKIDWRKASGSKDVDGVETDSRKVTPNKVFVAIRGISNDGHDYIVQAIQSGAAALVVESKDNVPNTYEGAVLEVLDTRWALAELLGFIYHQPQDRLIAIAVTGTNGKTSTCYMIEHILNFASIPCGVMGTIDHHFKNQIWKTSLTTPDTKTFFERLDQFCKLGAKAFVMEVSSHGLKQKRIPISFDIGIFSNLSRDHLDYHLTMEDYLESKSLLFKNHLKQKQDVFAILNEDDAKVRDVQAPGAVRLGFGKSEKADFQFQIKNISFSGCEFVFTESKGHSTAYKMPMIGSHNVYNMVSALVVARSLGVPASTCQQAVAQFRGVPGRLEKASHISKIHSFIDYAHTPDALEQALKTLQEIKTKHNISNRIFCVFGCGGDRDKGKRPQMAEVAEKYADQVIVTSDNPRSEDPQKIIDEIMAGFLAPESVFSRVKRLEAMKLAVEKAKPNDVILIAGKGHEDYQIIGDQTLPFSDLQHMKDLLK